MHGHDAVWAAFFPNLRLHHNYGTISTAGKPQREKEGRGRERENTGNDNNSHTRESQPTLAGGYLSAGPLLHCYIPKVPGANLRRISPGMQPPCQLQHNPQGSVQTHCQVARPPNSVRSIKAADAVILRVMKENRVGWLILGSLLHVQLP